MIKIYTQKARIRNQILTEKEIERVYRETKDPLTRILIWFGLNFGLRPNELCNLKLSDIDLDRGWVVVTTTRMARHTRRIPMTERQKKILKKWMDTRNKKPLEHHYLFYSRTHLKLTPSSFYNILKNVSKKLRISIYPHKLRRTYATNLWRMGVPLHVISGRLGHQAITSLDGTLGKLQREGKIKREYFSD